MSFKPVLVSVVWAIFIAYSAAWLIIAFASNPTWWWFVPIYGDFKIFQASVWWGMFHVLSLPAIAAAALAADRAG